MDENLILTPHRTKILNILLEQGEITDPDGQATSLLMMETGHRTTNALSGVLLSMEQAGLVERDTAGRRTYRIALTKEGRRLAEKVRQVGPAPKPSRAARTAAPAEPTAAPALPTFDGEVDYDLLAAVLLKKALIATQAQEGSAASKEAVARAERAEALVAELEAQIEALRNEADQYQAEINALRDEAAEARAMLKTLEHNNGVLASQMDKVRKAPGTPVKDLISRTELRELDKLMKSLPTARG